MTFYHSFEIVFVFKITKSNFDLGNEEILSSYTYYKKLLLTRDDCSIYILVVPHFPTPEIYVNPPKFNKRFFLVIFFYIHYLNLIIILTVIIKNNQIDFIISELFWFVARFPETLRWLPYSCFISINFLVKLYTVSKKNK